MRPRLLVPLLACLLLAGAALAQDTGPQVIQPVAQPHPLVFSGKIYNSSSVPVISPFPGTVARVFHELGEPVRKGDPLIEIKLEQQMVLEVKRRLAVDATVKRTELDIARTELELRNLTEKRNMLEVLVRDGMATARDLQLTVDQIGITEQSLAAMRNALKQIRADQADQIKLYSEQFGRPVRPGNVPSTILVSAPTDGIVLQAVPEAEPGMRVSGRLFVIGCMNPMIIRAQAFESDAAQLKVGQEATAEVEALGGTRLRAKLTSISWTPTSNQLESPSYYLLEFSVDNPDNTLREGYKVRITFQPKPDGQAVPAG
ncbi:efflux RND transporter periplasmic adaptor subunit [Desulfovibrio aminophilus]|nr:HlyD family efflux transporter periplasmic adaptor subunit [Desulfovibrio aminophilus]MCM0754508.1 efflux RND transporter periplasmic adaptor subunit [Desulfovibrio aminophilus]